MFEFNYIHVPFSSLCIIIIFVDGSVAFIFIWTLSYNSDKISKGVFPKMCHARVEGVHGIILPKFLLLYLQHWILLRKLNHTTCSLISCEFLLAFSIGIRSSYRSILFHISIRYSKDLRNLHIKKKIISVYLIVSLPYIF